VEDELEVKCDVKDPSLCSAKEKAYIEKMKTKSKDERKAQLDRLAKMKGSSMTSDLKRWLNQRLNILKGFAESDEL
jgi:protein disulfide-isomerase A6